VVFETPVGLEESRVETEVGMRVAVLGAAALALSRAPLPPSNH
jgi:hypothetical protein